MFQKTGILILLMGVLASGIVFAEAGKDKMELEPYIGSADFQKLKELIGTWSGTHQMGEEVSEAQVEYTVTSNGSAIIEKLFPGTPHEMISVYHDKAGKLSMTHYCSFANQPQMDLTS